MGWRRRRAPWATAVAARRSRISQVLQPRLTRTRTCGVQYVVRHRDGDRVIDSPPLDAEAAVHVAVVLAAAGRRVQVLDETGCTVDVEALAEEILRRRR